MPKAKREHSRWAGPWVAVSHTAVWLIVLGLRRDVVHYSPPDWNFFPLATIWRDLYFMINAPVHWLYQPIGEWARETYRGGWYDVAIPTPELRLNYAFHLTAFLIWWYILGTGVSVAGEKLSAWRRGRASAADPPSNRTVV